jgi:hypothetical protein
MFPPEAAAMPRYTVHKHVAWREIDGEVFLVTPDSRLHDIRPGSGHLIFQAIQAGGDEERAADLLVERFEVGREQARADVAAFVAKLVELGILTPVE